MCCARITRHYYVGYAVHAYSGALLVCKYLFSPVPNVFHRSEMVQNRISVGDTTEITPNLFICIVCSSCVLRVLQCGVQKVKLLPNIFRGTRNMRYGEQSALCAVHAKRTSACVKCITLHSCRCWLPPLLLFPSAARQPRSRLALCASERRACC